MLTKRQATKLRRLITAVAEAHAANEWQKDQGYRAEAIAKAAKDHADALVALNQYINTLTEKA
jgi:hypothetical protein